MSDETPIGSVIANKYRLDEELGRGGMGAVYRAFHLFVHKQFAIKLLLAEAAERKSIATRFFLEAQAAGRIGHPGILEVYDVGQDDGGRPFIVMELLRGEPLSAFLRKSTPAPQTACWIAAQILDILDAAHRAGVVHRDVKPQNVFLCEGADGRKTVKLLDFGIAKFAAGADASAITRSGEIIGSPLYMAPEQAKGEADVDARADVWSVGALLFEMLTGAPAHVASTPVAVLAKILTEPAPRPSKSEMSPPAELDAVVERALSIDRQARFESARAMLEALREASAALGWPDTPSSLPAASRRDAPSRGTSEVTTNAAIASTIEAPSVPPSAHPTAGAAAVATRSRASRIRGLAIVLVVAGVLGLSLVPWLLRRGAATPAPASSASSAKEPSVVASVADSAPPAVASAEAVDAAPLAVGSVPAGPPKLAPPSSKPRCGPGEVVSEGHCCPRGLVWQSGRCERPLATSF